MQVYKLIIKAGGIDMVKEIVAEEFESEVLGADVPVLVDFWAEWCNPCKMMTPIFKEISTEIGSQMKFFLKTARKCSDLRDSAKKRLCLKN